jgi:hypothetical protein
MISGYTPHVLMMLVAWLCAPSLAVTIVVQVWFFTRRGVFRRGHGTRAVIGFLLTVIGVLALSVPLWLVFPRKLLFPSGFPDGWLPPLFPPAILASLVVGTLVSWWVVRDRSVPGSRPDGGAQEKGTTWLAAAYTWEVRRRGEA